MTIINVQYAENQQNMNTLVLEYAENIGLNVQE